MLESEGSTDDRSLELPRDNATQTESIFCPAAGAAAYRWAMLESIRLPRGYFDPDHFLYYEDLDLGWRARLAGWTALCSGVGIRIGGRVGRMAKLRRAEVERRGWEGRHGAQNYGFVIDDDNTYRYFVIMIRTQISLSEEEYTAAKREAKRLGIPLAELLRRSLRGVLPADSDKPWMRHAGVLASGDPDASLHIDDVVYGHKA